MMFLALRSAITLAWVMFAARPEILEQMGSWLGASPNHKIT